MHVAASVTYTSESKKRERTKLKRFRFALTLGRSAATGENAQRSTYTPGYAARGHGCSIPSAAPDPRGSAADLDEGTAFLPASTSRRHSWCGCSGCSSFALTFLRLPICMTSSRRKARGNGRLRGSSTHRCKAPLSRRRDNHCGSTPPSSRCSSRPKARPSTQNLERREQHAVSAVEKVARVRHGGCQGYAGSEFATTIFRHPWTHGQSDNSVTLTTLSL